MDLQTFFNSKSATWSIMWLGRHLPRSTALVLVRLSTSLISRRTQSPLVRSIRLNQSVARDLPQDAPELDVVVRRVLYNAARGYYEIYNRIAQGREVVQESFTFGPDLFAMLRDARSTGRGIVVVAPHLGNLDLGLAGFAAEGYDIQAITYEAAPGGYQLQNRMREGSGYIITPADAEAAKMAFDRLRRGGIVLTGVDRPLPNGAKSVRFFGRPAPLPTGYIRLALSTDSLFFVVWLESVNGGYVARAAGPIDLVRTGNRLRDAAVNAEKVLEIAEEKIRAQPDEWMMFHPVWPQLMTD
jgi:lauroyl/myristoyl acyltransferase